jgi:hypothetical protein
MALPVFATYVAPTPSKSECRNLSALQNQQRIDAHIEPRHGANW